MNVGRSLRIVWCATIVLFALFVLRVAFGVGASFAPDAVGDWMYDALEALAIGIIVARVIALKADRLAFGVLAAGMASSTIGDVISTIDPPQTFPSIVDAFYLPLYPAAYIALVLMIRNRARDAGATLWIDGAIALLGTAAIGAAIVVREVAANTGGSLGVVSTTLAYPALDMVLIGTVVTALSLGTWRRERWWWILAAGFVLDGASNAIYSYEASIGNYLGYQYLETMWPLSFLVLAGAATLRRDVLPVRAKLVQASTVTAVAAASGVAILALGSLGTLDPLTAVLATAAVLGALARLVIALRENRVMLRRTSTAATTDALTSLGNRRLLMDQLEAAAADTEGRYCLVLFDLDGFKSYNDAFGHVAGDVLLARLGRRLEEATDGPDAAFRLGGDEFCVLAEIDDEPPRDVVGRYAPALCERGDGFEISASAGAVVLPDEASDAVQALQVADRRMYAEKNAKPSRRVDVYQTLLAVVAAGGPNLTDHARGMAELATMVGARLGVQGSALLELRRAAELHDVGKIAIPEAILEKPGPLDASEWSFMHSHTVIGERLLAVAGELSGVARIVRSSHEQWEGTGYPDGLAGEAIPLAARIIAVCDAFEAMCSERPYRDALSRQAAIGELRRTAGSQFDPIVVDAFEAVAFPESQAEAA